MKTTTGIDDNGRGSPDSVITARLKPVGQEYQVLGQMMPELAQWAFEGKIKTVIEDDDHKERTIDLGTWQAVAIFGAPGRGNAPSLNQQSLGKIMVVKLSEDKFIVVGTHARITFKSIGRNSGRPWQYVKVEEGKFENGKFKTSRILNGDETDWGGPYLGINPRVLQISLIAR